MGVYMYAYKYQADGILLFNVSPTGFIENEQRVVGEDLQKKLHRILLMPDLIKANEIRQKVLADYF